MRDDFLIVIQARMNSSRLPGKVLSKLGDYTTVEILTKRLLNSFSEKSIIYVTPNAASDDVLCREIERLGVRCIRGSEDDLYSRFSLALIDSAYSKFVRITADCPLISAELLIQGIRRFENGNFDIVHTGKSFPEGLDFEIVSTLEFLNLKNLNLSKLEKLHPTLYFYENNHRYSILDFEMPNSEDCSAYRVTLDEGGDLEVLREIAIHFKERIFNASWDEIKLFIDKNQHLLKLNGHIKRNEGLLLDKNKK